MLPEIESFSFSQTIDWKKVCLPVALIFRLKEIAAISAVIIKLSNNKQKEFNLRT